MKGLIKENYPEKYLESMRKGLESDGWIPTTILPSGWLKRKMKNWQFLTPSYQIIRKAKDAEDVFEQGHIDKALLPLLRQESAPRISGFLQREATKRKSGELNSEEIVIPEASPIKKSKVLTEVKGFSDLPKDWKYESKGNVIQTKSAFC